MSITACFGSTFNPGTASTIVKLDFDILQEGERAGDAFVVVIYDVTAGLQMTVDGFGWLSLCHPIRAAAAPFRVW